MTTGETISGNLYFDIRKVEIHGRFLVLAETQSKGEAVDEMKRYLILMPDAVSARAAQDKIYEWEPKAH